MKPLSTQVKVSLINRARAGEKVAQLCREAKISRKTFYQWLKKYNSTRPNLAVYKLADHRFKSNFSHKSVHPKDKLLIVNKYLVKEDTAVEICKKFNISRKSLYAWLKNYQKNGEAGLYEMRPKGENHYRYLATETQELILYTVSQHPDFSVHTLTKTLSLGHHGIQNLLERKNLNTKESRQIFAEGYITTPKTKVSPLYEPQIPIYRLRQIIAPFTTIPKIIKQDPKKGFLALLSSLLPILLFFFWIKLLIFAPAGTSRIGLVFATISLNFGLIFFLYSLKYYISAALVLKLANSGPSGTQKPRVTGRFAKVFNKLWHYLPLAKWNNYGKRTVNPLLLNFEKITLFSKPFVSIHVAIYNEKNVIERLIKATTSQNWLHPSSGQANYELIIVDDSNDETTQIALNVLKETYANLSETKIEDTTLYKGRANNLPTVTLIHRSQRFGFKGGALQNALEATDPAADYIVVFDADFVPYPDTIEQFMKAFQALRTGTSSQRLEASNQKLDPRPYSLDPDNIAAVQGYQWHVLNKSQTWVTRGVRTEYAGSYVIERSSEEIYGGLKQIAGSVYAIRADILRKFGWGKSITEDFELTLRLYEAGYKVSFIPYIQAPAEAVSTIKRLIRQRMRWAEGASFNIKVMFKRMLKSKNLTGAEKFEFVYLAPYYLQAAFFVVGTLSWFISEAILHSSLPFWTAAFGWSLVFTNLLSLPLMNIIGLFLEESDERDYLGIFSFIALSYIVVPFQAYAAIKGFIEPQEGPWFRTPKTGLITDVLERSSFGKFFGNIFGKPQAVGSLSYAASDAAVVRSSLPTTNYQLQTKLAFASAYNPLRGNIGIKPRHIRWVGNVTLGIVIALSVLLSIAAPFIPQATSYASQPALKTVEQAKNQPEDRAQPQDGHSDQFESEITTPRAIQKTNSKGVQVEAIFHQEPRIRLKLDGREVEFETKTINGQNVHPNKSLIYQDKEVTYKEVLPNIDLKYTMTGDLLVEEVILHEPLAGGQKPVFERSDQSLNTVDIKVVYFDASTFAFYPNECPSTSSGQAKCSEVFKLSAPFAKDAKGEVSNDFRFTLDKATFGYTLTKTAGSSTKGWFADPARVYPITVDPTVITVIAPITSEAAAQFGGLQRKIAYIYDEATPWSAFVSDGGRVIYYSSYNGSSWSNGTVLDTTDNDNYNPSVSVSGTTIIVFWIDDSADAVEGRTLEIVSQSLGTLCTSADQGTLDLVSGDMKFMVTAAAVSTTEAVVAYSDTNSDTEVDVFDVTGLSGTCTLTDVNPGNITFGSGVTAGDRPVVFPITGNVIGMVFQDGQLSYSELDVSVDEWTKNNLQIGAVTDNIYSVTTDGTTFWVLSVSGTTATNFYSCCTADFSAETQIDADAGANGQDDDGDIDMYCPTSTDCKIVYTDDIDSAAPVLTFVDCDNETCSSKTTTALDTDIGDAGKTANPKIYCVATDNCKIIYGDDITSANSPDHTFVDCADNVCTAATATFFDIMTDFGAGTNIPETSIDCVGGDTDCKVLVNDAVGSDLSFVDCTDYNCNSTTLNDVDNAVGIQPKNDLYCLTASNCKVVYHDTAEGDVNFVNCGGAGTPATCVTLGAEDIGDIDTDVSTTVGAVPVALDCVGGDTDCKVIYGDNTAGDLFFVDCAASAADCQDKDATTDIDSAGGNGTTTSVDLHCVSATDCKFTYVGDLTSGSEKLYFVDCDDAGGSCTSGSVIALPGPRFRASLKCVDSAGAASSTNCKFAYYEGTASTQPTVMFADCDVTNCFPSVTDEPDPWGSPAETNVTSVSLSLDTTNSKLYAHVIKETNEKAYFESSDKTAISWGSETDYGWSGSGNHLGHINSPITGAGDTQIAVVLRETNNYEFATVPERALFLLGVVPFLPKLFGKLKKRKVKF